MEKRMTPMMLDAVRETAKGADDPAYYRLHVAIAGKYVIGPRMEALAANGWRDSHDDYAPPSARLPMPVVLVQVWGQIWQAFQFNGDVRVQRLIGRGFLPLFTYRPGTMDSPSWVGISEVDTYLANLPEHAKMSHAQLRRAWINLMSILNTPGIRVTRLEKGNVSHQQKVRKLTGKAATAWTNVDVVPGAVRQAMRNETTGDHRAIALHERAGHYAWLPSQRQTPKAQWLVGSDMLKLPRGPGWYVWRKATRVGSAEAGVKPQRRLAHLPGDGRPDIGNLPSNETAEERQFRLQILSEAQRALLVMSGAVQSSTLH
jgi:hypothetical protein